jgi:hypothetical protein
MLVTLISTYELGRQPFGLASPAAWLRRAGAEVVCCDLARGPLDLAAVGASSVVAWHLPMHTATRLALPVIRQVRALNPAARLVAYGLYAPPNATLLRASGITDVLGPECEADLAALATPGAPADPRPGEPVAGAALPRLAFIRPDRTGLPPLASYATLQMPDGARRIVGYTEATRGCRHRCRHCPIVPVYQGHFRVVPRDVVLADIHQQVSAGASHISFGDPDFLNGPTHARRLVEALADECPGVTYDVVIKVEHLLQHRDLLPRLRETGCLFVTSALEAVDDDILARLDKGHTREDIVLAAGVMRDAGLPLVPTFVAFTPWTTADVYLDMLDAIEELGLVEHVAPIQLAIRLLLPQGSLLLGDPDVQRVVTGFDPLGLAHAWRHPDPRMDFLQREIAALVGRRVSAPRAATFAAVRARARVAAAMPHDRPLPASPAASDAGLEALSRRRTLVPYMNEPWYC